MPTLEELRDIRLQKIAKLKDLGIDPYPAIAKKDHTNNHIVEHFDDVSGKTVSLAGRLMSLREHGNLTFGDIVDQSGSIQLFIKKGTIQDTNKKEQIIGFADLDLLDVGDFLEVTGEITKTSAGEISILVHTLRMLTKSIRPLPDKHEGIKDPEIIFRRRYLDLVMNPERKEVFKRKSKFWEVNRAFLKKHGFMEVETPVLEHVTGGADARPFVTHMNALNQDFYLRISTELYQKRLMGGGFEKVFTVGPNFRNEGISDEHLPEYYQVEWYWAYANYKDNMNLVRDMFREIATQVYGKTTFTRGEHTFDLADEWTEIDYGKTIKERLGIDIFSDTDKKMASVLKKQGIVLEGAVNRNRLIDNLWKVIRKTLSGPAFLINEPKFMSPLSKSIAAQPELTERFHVILAGSELGNGYSELNDPIDQLDRFRDQQSQRNAGDEEAQMMDVDFVEMLEYGMPPTSGYGHSERVFWFLEGVTAREGTLFPHLRHLISDQSKKIYGLTESTIPKPPSTQSAVQDTLPEGLSVDVARGLLKIHIKHINLERHCLAVGYAMRALAEKFAGNPDVWQVLGILHDADWEETKDTPEEHTKRTLEWLTELGITEGSIVRALKSHNRKLTELAEIDGIMEWSLETCDELTGFIVAVALIRPEKTLSSVTVESVMKKWKTKEFAKAVDRDHIAQCEQMLGISLEEFVTIVLTAMQKHADELGL
jgi:lysyl-tRNA synthetase class 2